MNAPDLHNLPPHSLEAEHGLLGAILTHGGPVLDRIEGTVSASDFYRADHHLICGSGHRPVAKGDGVCV